MLSLSRRCLLGLVGLVVLASSAASAQSFVPLPPPPTPPGVEPEVAPLRLARATTMSGLAGLAVAFGATWGPAYSQWRTGDEFVALSILSGASWATPLVTSLGIWAGGRGVGGRGNYGITVIGATLGSLVGAVPAGISLAFAATETGAALGFIAIPILQWVGGLVAYHGSHRVRVRRAREGPPPGRLLLAPSARIERGGGSLVLSGVWH